MVSPPIYLKRCLEAGFDPNTYKHLQRTFLELAAQKCKVRHVELLLENTSTKLTPRAAKFILKNKFMKKFLPLLFERGLPANPGYVIQALQQNNSDLLRGSLTALIRTDPTKKRWAKVEETLTCPLLLQATTDLVQTPQGQFYDGPSLLRWIGENETDPLTRQRLIVDDLRTREDIVPEIIQLIQQFDE